MYLEERVDKIEAFMELLIKEHPEFCPHQWLYDGGTTLKNKQISHLRCRFCGKQEEKEIDIQPVTDKIPTMFSF